MIGGVSQIAELPKEMRQEAIMALVGPVVSLGLGGGLYLLHVLSGEASFNLRFALFYLASLNLDSHGTRSINNNTSPCRLCPSARRAAATCDPGGIDDTRRLSRRARGTARRLVKHRSYRHFARSSSCHNGCCCGTVGALGSPPKSRDFLNEIYCHPLHPI
jgi:hypothetical protein